jgi:hypothetical protein
MSTGMELRFHDTVLCNSIYYSDDELLINPHVYGLPAAEVPILHLYAHQGGSMAHMYPDSFEHVWNSAEGSAALGREICPK